MNQQQIEALTYWDAVRLAQNTDWNVNHAGWIVHQDADVKYTLDTLDEGLSFRIGRWQPGKNTGSIIRTVHAPAEIEFLFGLREVNHADE